jgi:hypothetical protein
MHRYFESRLQRTLAWYALVPVLIMVFLGSLLMLDNWRYAVIQVNHEARELAADVLSNISKEFLHRSEVEAEFLGTVPELSLWESDKALRSEAFARLYSDTSYREWSFTCWIPREGSFWGVRINCRLIYSQWNVIGVYGRGWLNSQECRSMNFCCSQMDRI